MVVSTKKVGGREIQFWTAGWRLYLESSSESVICSNRAQDAIGSAKLACSEKVSSLRLNPQPTLNSSEKEAKSGRAEY